MAEVNGGVEYTPKNILVTGGAGKFLGAIVWASADPTDEMDGSI
jgi:hypothetical protein